MLQKRPKRPGRLKKTNKTMDYLRIIEKYYELSPKDLPEYEKYKVGPMTVEAKAYSLPGLGHMSFMRGKALFGLMKMDTLVFNPFEKDMPLFSLDRITVSGKEKLLIELFETRLAPVSLEQYFTDLIEKYQLLDDGKSEPRWYDEIRLPETMYKVGKKNKAAAFDNLSGDYLERFLCLCSEAKPCDAQTKTAEAKKYTDGLLSHGGAATDVYIKEKGREFTERFLRECMFGV